MGFAKSRPAARGPRPATACGPAAHGPLNGPRPSGPRPSSRPSSRRASSPRRVQRPSSRPAAQRPSGPRAVGRGPPGRGPAFSKTPSEYSHVMNVMHSIRLYMKHNYISSGPQCRGSLFSQLKLNVSFGNCFSLFFIHTTGTTHAYFSCSTHFTCTSSVFWYCSVSENKSFLAVPFGN